ncbi:MAG TPA: flagellar hook-length control protein FliK [Malonomonas sp.]
MHTLSMIDTTAKGYEAMAPAKPAEQKSERFGKLLNEKQQPRTEKAAAPKQADRTERAEPSETKAMAKQDQPVAEQSVGSSPAAAGRELADKPAASQEQVRKPLQVAQQLIDLLQTIAAGETPEAIEQFGSIEPQLNHLLEQLDSSELQGEQVLAGIDLSQLVEQLQTISSNPDGKAQLAELVTELEAQLNTDVVLLENAELNSDAQLLANAELAAASMIKPEHLSATQPLVENLAQARQVLQKAINALSGNQSAQEQQVVATEKETVETAALPAQGESKIDPRFAGLLTPRMEHRQDPESLRERVQQNNAQPAATAHQAQTGESVPVAPEVKAEAAVVAGSEQFGAATKQPLENLIQQLQGNGQQQQPAENVRSMPTIAPTVQLPSGQQVAESQIFDQVVTRMSGSFNGESGKMVLRLQPAELGSLKLELVIEGDKVRASLVAQSQQVQEVLERNLPQLRSALAEQGLKIDQFQVDVEQRQQQGQFDNLAQQQQQRGRSPQHSVWQQQSPAEEQIIPLAHLMNNGGAGISLRV